MKNLIERLEKINEKSNYTYYLMKTESKEYPYCILVYGMFNTFCRRPLFKNKKAVTSFIEELEKEVI